MRKRILISEQEIPAALAEIQAAMKKTKDARMYRRYQAICMMLEGESYEKISSYTGLSPATIFNYRKAYYEKGIAGLERKLATGRPKFLTPEQEQQVYQTVVERTPVDVGFPMEMNWTAPLVREWIQQTFQVKYSDRGTRDLLYRLNLSYTKPTYTLEKADAAKQEAFKATFETVKKNSLTDK